MPVTSTHASSHSASLPDPRKDEGRPCSDYWLHFENERWNDALVGANAALAAQPDNEMALFVLGACLLRSGRIGDVQRVLDHALAVGTPTSTAAVAAKILSSLLEGGCHGELRALAEFLPLEHPAAIIASYYAGCAEMVQGRMDAALVRFDWFRTHCQRFAGHIDFFSDPRLNLVFRQGRLVSSPEEVARRAALPMGQIRPRWHADLTPNVPGPILLTCMDSVYFAAFAQQFAELNLAANPASPVVFHLIGPTPETLALLDQLATRWPGRVGGMVEDEPAFRRVTYYACARFYVVPFLLERFHRPVVSLDAEIRAELEQEGLALRCAPFDFACFGTGRKEPASVWQASVMWWADSPECHRLLNLLQHYCWPELGLPAHANWMLDQAALFSCRHYAALTGAPMLADLAEVTQKSLGEVTRRFEPDHRNESLRNASIGQESLATTNEST